MILEVAVSRETRRSCNYPSQTILDTLKFFFYSLLRALILVNRSSNSRLSSSMNATKAYMSGVASLFSMSVGK